MNGEIDLELYTISIIRLNNALEKLGNSQLNDEVKAMFKESSNGFQDLYEDILSDLNLDELQLNEYYLFFENGKQIFPQYIETLKEIRNEEIRDYINSIINVLKNLHKIANAFPSQQEMI